LSSIIKREKREGGRAEMKNTESKNTQVVQDTMQEAVVRRQQEILNKELCCSICGSKLLFTHFIDYDSKKIKESAVCNDCGVRYQTRDFSLN
jgi:hypothetical protein